MKQDQLEPLLAPEDSERFRSRWETIQRNFVDEPQRSVDDADALVSDLMQRLTQTFQHEHQALEAQLKESEDVSTEELRVGLQRYRSFFERLLAT